MGALPVFFAILPSTDVFVPIGKGSDALPVCFAILVFTDVFVPIGRGIGTMPVFFAMRSNSESQCFIDSSL